MLFTFNRPATGLHGLPARTGKLKTLDRFDANFFGVHAKQAEVMDPQLRLLLETTYECIVDAGKPIFQPGRTFSTAAFTHFASSTVTR
jgi:acyl transferase domain-containing protein